MQKSDSWRPIWFMFAGMLVGGSLTLATAHYQKFREPLFVFWISTFVTSLFFAVYARKKEGIWSETFSFFRGYFITALATSPILWIPILANWFKK